MSLKTDPETAESSARDSNGSNAITVRFALWTQTRPGSDVANVASFAPDASMIPIAVLPTVSVRR